MARNLKFQYSFRQHELANTKMTESERIQKKETNDRDLEDFLANFNPGTSGQSLIAIYKDGGTYSALNSGGTDVVTRAVTMPATAGFTYWIDCQAHFHFHMDDDHSGSTKFVGFFGFIRDSSGFYIPDGYSEQHLSTSITPFGTGLDTSGEARMLHTSAASATETILVNVQNSAPAGQTLWTVTGDVTLHTKIWAVPI